MRPRGVTQPSANTIEMSEVTLQVESNPEAPGLSRSILSRIKSSLEPRYDDVLLVVSELVSNSVKHTSSDDIDVKVETHDGHVRVEVSDSGPGFTPATPRGDGLGLTIIEKLADRWGMSDPGDRFTVWAELSLD